MKDFDLNKLVEGTFLEGLRTVETKDSEAPVPEGAELIGELSELEKRLYSLGSETRQRHSDAILAFEVERATTFLSGVDEEPSVVKIIEISLLAKFAEACFSLTWSLVRSRLVIPANLFLGPGWKLYALALRSEDLEEMMASLEEGRLVH